MTCNNRKCQECTKTRDPIVYKRKSELEGSCNFCERHIGHSSLSVAPHEVFAIESRRNGGLKVRICKDCLACVKAIEAF